MGVRHVQCECLIRSQEVFGENQGDSVAIQEAKLATAECADAEQTARNSGWRTAVGPCTITAADGKSAGVAICGRTHVGMKNSICNEVWPKSLNERFILEHVAAVCRGGIHAGSCYLTSWSSGVKDQRNIDTLQLMAGVLNSVKGPWAIVGDWNCTPEELQQTGWLKLVQGATVAPKVHTCWQRIIDFFVISDGLRQAAPAVYTIGDGGSTRIAQLDCSCMGEPGPQ